MIAKLKENRYEDERLADGKQKHIVTGGARQQRGVAHRGAANSHEVDPHKFNNFPAVAQPIAQRQIAKARLPTRPPPLRHHPGAAADPATRARPPVAGRRRGCGGLPE